MGPGAGEERWVRAVLQPAEVALWASMSKADRRHAVGVARRVERTLGPAAAPEVLAAALLHDVGKVAAGLPSLARVGATLVGLAGGHRRATAWRERSGLLRRLGLYLGHAEVGAGMLADAGSHPTVVRWAAEHHLTPARWTLPLEVARALKDADDD